MLTVLMGFKGNLNPSRQMLSTWVRNRSNGTLWQ
uniref:Uncharacterized protein n=1 Tax=Anguilla anguilla TaxID=7936 RepID=A0A0E9XD72_ANGAN